MKTFYIKDLEPNLIISQETFVLKDVITAQDKNGKTYYDLVLADKTGEIRAKIWSDAADNCDMKAAKKGRVVSVGAKVDTFRGALQLTVYSLSGVDETALDEYVESSTFPADQLWQELEKTVNEISEPTIKELLQKIMEHGELGRKLRYWPAGMTIHHSFRSGLLQHILEMMTVADGLEKYFPDANWDIVRGGIFLHDIGKLRELSSVGMTTDYERIGNLLGHITLGVQIVDELASKDMPLHIKVHLQHIILSHHGQLDMGSPVVPATVEAVIVSNADRISAEARRITESLRKEGEDGMTKYSHFSGTRYWDGGNNLLPNNQ